MSLSNLKTRLKYSGGSRQVDRMIKDKEKSFKDSLWKSYQSATIVLTDGREFRCLINPNKISLELDDKMLSVPFKDKCLNREPEEAQVIGVKCGDVVEWKENGTHWIIYSQYLQEIAYFRGLMRQCENEPLSIGGKQVWYYLKGPDEKTIDWQKTKHLIFNVPNYTAEIYISNTEEIKQLLQRFKKIKLKGKAFEVQTVDDLTIDGIVIVYIKETYNNQWVTEDEDSTQEPEISIPEHDPYVTGPLEVYPYDIVEYTIFNASGGQWSLSNDRARIIQQNDTSVKIEIITGKSGSISLIYSCDSIDNIKTDIKILSL